jgi:N-acetylglucosamine-6-phosphate deacetylase
MNSAKQHALAADHVFDGTTVRRDAAVLIDGTRIVDVVPRGEVPPSMAVRALGAGTWLAPGFVDLQVNGGGDCLFNDNPTVEGICTIARAHRRHGTTALLPTLMTDTAAKMTAALAAVDVAMEREPGVLGIHLEGPFLSPEKPGVHDRRLIRAPTPSDVELLTAPRKGATLVTLAPERVPGGFIARLVASGVLVSLGHSAATYAQTRTAMAEGLKGFTHLFNAMPPLLSREPGPVAAALESRDAWYGLIADGIHVDPAMLRLALRGAGHPMLVSDAMPPVGGNRSAFELYGEPITVIDGRCTRQDGTLAGAFLTVAQAVRNCVELLDVPLEQALRYASTNPASFIGLGHVLGRLAGGFRADMVAFDPASFEIVDTWVAGS